VVTTRSILKEIDSHVAESIGVREDCRSVVLSPVPATRDLGRRPAKGFGRLALDQVIPDPAQPRTEFDEASLISLAENLRINGQLHPIHVRWSDESQKWLIISGERRWRAAHKAGLAMVDCYFHEEYLSSSQILELQLIENLLREDLKPIEEARGFQSLLEMNAWTGKQLAETLRLPESKVSRALALLKLPPDLQQQVDRGSLPARTAYELSKIADDRLRRDLARRSAAGSLTTADVAKVARRRKRQSLRKQPGAKQTFYSDGGWTVIVSKRQNATYDEMEQALLQALDEVRLRIANNIRL
jgi:ParB family chromosome partitioning protein